MITHPSVPETLTSTTDPKPNLSSANAKAERAYDESEEIAKQRPRSNWYNKR